MGEHNAQVKGKSRGQHSSLLTILELLTDPAGVDYYDPENDFRLGSVNRLSQATGIGRTTLSNLIAKSREGSLPQIERETMARLVDLINRIQPALTIGNEAIRFESRQITGIGIDTVIPGWLAFQTFLEAEHSQHQQQALQEQALQDQSQEDIETAEHIEIMDIALAVRNLSASQKTQVMELIGNLANDCNCDNDCQQSKSALISMLSLFALRAEPELDFDAHSLAVRLTEMCRRDARFSNDLQLLEKLEAQLLDLLLGQEGFALRSALYPMLAVVSWYIPSPSGRQYSGNITALLQDLEAL